MRHLELRSGVYRDSVQLMQISASLAAKAALPSYIQFQREAARTTVTEFVTKWLVTQQRWQPASDYKVQVFFADEPIEALGAAPPPFVREQ